MQLIPNGTDFQLDMRHISVERMNIEEGAEVLALADDRLLPSIKHEDGTERFQINATETVIYLNSGTFLRVKYVQ